MKAASYREAINKYVENGVAEEVPCGEITPTDGRPVFYLPHHRACDHQGRHEERIWTRIWTPRPRLRFTE